VIFSGHDEAPITVSRLNVPADTRARIEAFVKREQLVKFVTISGSNIRINQREILYAFSNDPYINTLFELAEADQGTTFTLFGTNEAENSQIVSMINGEFRCDEFKSTSFSTRMPELERFTQTICRISLPPYYGEFSGYITIGVSAGATPALIERIRLEGSRISTELYFKNFRSSTYEGRR
jgi:hypothetical protein